MSSKFVRTAYPTLAVMRDYICGDLTQKCPICFNVLNGVREHIRKCQELDLMRRKYIILNFDSRIFLCLFGCRIKTTSYA